MKLLENQHLADSLRLRQVFINALTTNELRRFFPRAQWVMGSGCCPDVYGRWTLALGKRVACTISNMPFFG
jgi:hypothetical protein